jgi:hypothetical protein
VRGDVSTGQSTAFAGADAYDLLDQLPPLGPVLDGVGEAAVDAPIV